MKNIKFRAWQSHKNKMLSHDDMVRGGWSFDDFNVDGSESEIMQYTGIKDKNGKEIYEGDILEFTNKWEWYKGSYGIPVLLANKDELVELKKKYEAEPMHRFEVEFDSYDGYNISKYDLAQGWLEVIGNIYENPELLEKGNK